MSQPGDSNGWLAWILGAAGVATVVAILWRVISQIFNYVTRDELAKIVATQNAQFVEAMEQQRAEILRLHGENGGTNTAIFQQLREQDKAIARIEGALSGRYPTIGPNAR